MARIVEFIGPAGVGKSTLYNALVAKWHNNANWIPDARLIASCARQKVKYDSSQNFALTLLKNIFHKSDKAILKAAAQRFADKFPEFMDLIWNHICSEKRIHNKRTRDLRFDTTNLVFKRVQQAQLMLESDCKKIVLHDEGIINWAIPLIHRAYIDDAKKEMLHQFISKMYLPLAMIYVLCDEKENAKRLANRSRLIHRHKGLDIKELEQSALSCRENRDYVIGVLESNGTPVLRINSANHIEANITEIVAFVDSLQSPGKHHQTESLKKQPNMAQ